VKLLVVALHNEDGQAVAQALNERTDVLALVLEAAGPREVQLDLCDGHEQRRLNSHLANPSSAESQQLTVDS
jgi:hypothetical protein